MDDEVLGKKELIINDKTIPILKILEKEIILRLYYIKEYNLDNMDYRILPKLNIEWNKHLIAHIILNLSNKLKIKTIGNKYNSLIYIVEKKED